MLLSDAELRKLLGTYAGGKLSEAESKRLLKSARPEKPLATALKWAMELQERFPESSLAAPKPLTRLFLALSKTSPVSGLVLRPAVMAPVLKSIGASKIMPKQELSVLSLLHNNCPCLADILQSDLLANDQLTFPLALLPLIGWLGERCEKLMAGAIIVCTCLILHPHRFA